MKILNTFQYNKYDFAYKNSENKNNISNQNNQEKENEKTINKEVQELKRIEQEVIAHELAHVSVGGKYAGSPSYSYTTGPDGNNYISGGEVPIDTSPENEPKDTIMKMQQVRAAALAPAKPSGQDMAVASKASQIEMRARQDLNKQSLAEINKGENFSVYA